MMFDRLRKLIKDRPRPIANHVHDMQVLGAKILFGGAVFAGVVAVLVFKGCGG